MAPDGWPPTAADDDRCPTGIAVGVGAVVVVAAPVLAALLARTPGPRLGLLTGAVGVFAAVSGGGRAALAVAGLAWPVGNGFLVNQLGVRSWHAGIDLWFVMGLLAAVSVGMLTAQARQELRTWRRWQPFTVLLAEPADVDQPAPRFPQARPGKQGGATRSAEGEA